MRIFFLIYQPNSYYSLLAMPGRFIILTVLQSLYMDSCRGPVYVWSYTDWRHSESHASALCTGTMMLCGENNIDPNFRITENIDFMYIG